MLTLTGERIHDITVFLTPEVSGAFAYQRYPPLSPPSRAPPSDVTGRTALVLRCSSATRLARGVLAGAEALGHGKW